jgi:hypothetical protein
MYGMTEVDADGCFVRRLEPIERLGVSTIFFRFLLLDEIPQPGELERAARRSTQGGHEVLGETDMLAVRQGMLTKGLVKKVREWELSAIAVTAQNQRQHSVVLRHVWAPGDVVITRNTEVAHRAPTERELALLGGQLRVLHRSISLA